MDTDNSDMILAELFSKRNGGSVNSLNKEIKNEDFIHRKIFYMIYLYKFVLI